MIGVVICVKNAMRKAVKKNIIGLVALLAIVAPTVAFADETITFSATSDVGGELFGRSGSIAFYANSFVPSADADTVQFNTAISYYDGTANIHDIGIVILGDSGGSPDNSNVIASTTISGASLTTGACAVPASNISTSEFSATLTSGVTYWVRMQRLGAFQAPNKNPALCANTGGGLGVMKYQTDSYGAWTDYGPNYGMYGSIDLSTASGGATTSVSVEMSTSTITGYSYCVIGSTSSVCTYYGGVTYLDWLVFSMWILFLLAILVSYYIIQRVGKYNGWGNRS